MKRVLIITYYWPPSGGAGVQRWLKFAKYLPQFGWQPVIYTPHNPEIPVIDESLQKDIPSSAEIIKTKIWEPYEWYKKFTGRKGERINTGFLNEGKKVTATEKIAVWLRGNLFIPDARKYWIKPSVKHLQHYLKQHPVDAVISTGPPHSMHLIALGLKKQFNCKWIADFRDPWTNIDYYHELMLTLRADRKHHQLEKEVLINADVVTVVGKTMAEEFETIAARNINVITNGFDSEDAGLEKIELDKKFTIAHIGTLVRSRNPVMLWQALADLLTEQKDFADKLEIKLIGKVDFQVRQSIRVNKLDDYVKYTDYLPHAQVAMQQQQAQVLLLILNNTPNARGILTGKFFEYLAAQRPVLCIGRRDGDAAKIISDTKCGVVCEHEDKREIKKEILEYFKQFRDSSLQLPSSNAVQQYSRLSLTKDLVSLLNKITT